MIDNGQLDVVAATYTITDERKKSWDFSTPYRTDYVGLMVRSVRALPRLRTWTARSLA
ncbi:MAG: transporter substrate-binding domain-containing protein [Collinsella sp.]